MKHVFGNVGVDTCADAVIPFLFVSQRYSGSECFGSEEVEVLTHY